MDRKSLSFLIRIDFTISFLILTWTTEGMNYRLFLLNVKHESLSTSVQINAIRHDKTEWSLCCEHMSVQESWLQLNNKSGRAVTVP